MNSLNLCVDKLARETLAAMAEYPEIIERTSGLKTQKFLKLVAAVGASAFFLAGTSLSTPAQATETQDQGVKLTKISALVQDTLAQDSVNKFKNELKNELKNESNPKLFGVKSGTEKEVIMALGVGREGGQSLSNEPTMEDFLDKGAKKLEKTFKAYVETLRGYNEAQKSSKESSKESSNSRELRQENEDAAFRLMSEAQTAYGTAAYHFSSDINGPAKGFKLDARYGKYLQYFYKPDDKARLVNYNGVTTKPTNTESLTDSLNTTNTNTNSPAQKPRGP